MKARHALFAACAGLALATPLLAQRGPAPMPKDMAPPVPGGDIPAKFTPPVPDADYIKRDVMIPMRDGVKLHTVIVIPKGAVNAPIILTRTPYNATGRAQRMESPHMLSILPEGDELFVKAGYIRVFQDIRGKYGSEGQYIVTRPPVGALNTSTTDHATDAYDTIDWLVNKANLPETNGKVGMLGSSYEGFTVVAALLHPHPALKVAAPESPMVDGWMGDDWFHYGAFRLPNITWIGGQTGFKGPGKIPPMDTEHEDYLEFLHTGSAGDWAKRSGFNQLPYWNKLSQHPAYDAFWQGQAFDKLLAANPSNVPTLWEQGIWDQEDMYGAIHSYDELKKVGHAGNNFLLMGPWRHSGFNYNGSSLGALNFEGDTAFQARRDVLFRFFDSYLRDGATPYTPPTATIYNTGENHWDRFKTWPLACMEGCPAPLSPMYLQADWGLALDKPAGGGDSYVSDPDKPVPFLPRPTNFRPGWSTYLVADQRFADGRTDVLTYETPPLDKAMRVSGVPYADIFAKTTGTDGDFVVKIIDVYPDEIASNMTMAGYELPLGIDIFRGRYRDSFEHPSAIPAGRVQEYKFRMPAENHVFLPGHRIMVQIQSSLFPVYDRNPQKYVPNIFFAKKEDYQKATVTVMHQPGAMSAVWLPLVPVDQSANLLP